MTKLKKTQNVTKLKLWQNLKTQNCDKSQKLKLWQNLNYDKSPFMKRKENFTGFLARTFGHLNNRWEVLWAAFYNFCEVFSYIFILIIKIYSDIYGQI